MDVGVNMGGERWEKVIRDVVRACRKNEKGAKGGGVQTTKVILTILPSNRKYKD